ncbi:MAG: TlpA family protein disulfide reductase [Bacteroidales bacterium]|nr:TlpA family protein disulfide reductase [Bacteroidales bacterium]
MKRLFASILFIILIGDLFAQCVFSGKISGYSFGRLHICEHFGEANKIVEVVNTNANGEFVFNFTQQEIGLYRIFADNEDYFDIIHSGENIRIETNIRNMRASMLVLESFENQQLYSYISQSELSEYKIGILRNIVKMYPEGDFLTLAEKELKKELAIESSYLDKAIKMKQGTFAARYLSYFRDINMNIAESEEKKMLYVAKNFPMDDLELLNSDAYHHFVVSYIKKYQPSEFLNAARELLNYFQKGKTEIFDKMFDYILDGFEQMERYDDLYALSTEYGNSCSSFSDNLKTRVKYYTDLRIGSKAPDFEIETLDGEDFSLSSNKGKYTLVVFWASWCTSCRDEIPRINEALSLFKRANVDVVGISLDEDESDLKRFVAENKLQFKVASDYLKWDGQIVQNYAVFSTPSFFLIDKDMNIISKPLSLERLFGQVESLIKF